MTPMPRLRKPVPSGLEKRNEELRARYGGYMTIADVMQEIGCSRPTAKKYMEGVDSFSICGKVHYQTVDFAKRIEESRTPAGV